MINSRLNFLNYLISFAILTRGSMSQNTINVNWNDSNLSCKDLILNQFNLVNMIGQSNSAITTNYVCKTNGELLAINNCNNETEKSIEILSYFFSTPENDAARQCSCQAKCKNLPQSFYTLKFMVGTQINYFTTSNPCVAFCNRGYEMYLTSYAMNSYPSFDVVSSVSKSFDSGCFNRLDDSNKKIRQLSLMKIELCKARIICNLLVKQYLKDIENVELAIYGQVFGDNHIMTSEQKYWVKPFDSTKPCIDLIDSSKNAFCINQYANDSSFYCFVDEIQLLGENNEVKDVKYAGTTLKLYACVEGTLNYLEHEAADTGECVCNVYVGEFMFSSDLLEEAYGNANEKFLKYANKNYYYSKSIVSFDYIKEEYSYGYCNCSSFENFYDYFCSATIYASCLIDQSKAIPKIFTSDDDKINFLKSIIADTPDMILGYKSEECQSLNTICSNLEISTPSCVYKKYSGFNYPTFKVSNNFANCVDNYFVSQGNDALNYNFDCSEGVSCDEIDCSIKMFSSCNNANLDTVQESFCSKYDYNCALQCFKNSDLSCAVDSFSSVYLLATHYEICVRKCQGVSLDILCDSNNFNNCEVQECKSLICNRCNNGDSSDCPPSCGCSENDTTCLCNQTCNDKNPIDQNYCFYPTTQDLPHKVSEKTKCLEICSNNSTQNEYLLCENCAAQNNTCCDALCENLNNTEQTNCILIDGIFKLISEKQKCLNNCNHVFYLNEELEKCESPPSCEENCETLDKQLENFCYFDNDLQKICITSYKMCLNKCSRQNIISTDCNGLNDYGCFIKYCDSCNKIALTDSNTLCQKECACHNHDITSIDECKCFSDNCINLIDSSNNICFETQNQYNLLSEFKFCTANCKNLQYDSSFTCNTCNSNSDCCKQNCPTSLESKCVNLNGVYSYYTVNEICNNSCQSIHLEVVDEQNCCLSACKPSLTDVCIRENNKYYNAKKDDFCRQLCVQKNLDIFVTDESYCCNYDCLNQNEQTFCVKSDNIYEYVSKQTFCDRKCNQNNEVILGNDSLCCEHQCYLEQPKHLLGSYCDESYKVYSSYLDLCTSKHCKDVESNVVFCSNNSTCTLETCKKQLAVTKCSQYVGNQSILIKRDGTCSFYDNICYANFFSNPNEGVFTCPSSNINDCVKSSDLLLKYTSVYQNPDINKYCRDGDIITATEKDFYQKCLNDTEISIENSECSGAACKKAFCTAKNCKKKCKSTEMLYWGLDCRIYESTCELNCLGLGYIDFFDVTKLLAVCSNNPQLPSNYLNLITLKQNVCLESGIIKLFNVWVPWMMKLFTDCYRLNSTDINDCKVKCKNWAQKLK